MSADPPCTWMDIARQLAAQAVGADRTQRATQRKFTPEPDVYTSSRENSQNRQQSLPKVFCQAIKQEATLQHTIILGCANNPNGKLIFAPASGFSFHVFSFSFHQRKHFQCISPDFFPIFCPEDRNPERIGSPKSWQSDSNPVRGLDLVYFCWPNWQHRTCSLLLAEFWSFQTINCFLK